MVRDLEKYRKDAVNSTLTESIVDELSDTMKDCWEACRRPDVLQNVYEVLAATEGQEIAKIAGWRPTMTGLNLIKCESTGESAWVSEEGRIEFEALGTKAFKKVDE